MSFDVNWDIDKYKEEHESDDHWLLRRNFMEKWKQSYPEKRLVCLARVFANIEFMGCRYPTEVMQEVARMSKEVNMNLTYNNDFGVNLPYSSSGRDSQTPSTGTTWGRFSGNNFSGATTLSVDFNKDIEPIADISETSHAMDSHDPLCRNPVGSSKPEDTMKTGSIDGNITKPDDGSKYVWDQFSSKVTQGSVSISKVLRTTYSKTFVPETSLHQNLASNDNSIWHRYPNKGLQRPSLLPELINLTGSQSSVQDKLQDSNIAGVLPLWRRRDPRVKQMTAITSAAYPNSKDPCLQQHELQTMKQQLVLDNMLQTEHIKSKFVDMYVNSEKISTDNDVNMQFGIHIGPPQDLGNIKESVYQTQATRNNFDGNGDRTVNSGPYVENSNYPQNYRASIPISEVKSLDENNAISHKQANCTNHDVRLENIPSIRNIGKTCKESIGSNEKIKTNASEGTNTKKSKQAKLRYQWWVQVAQKSEKEAEVLCLKPLNEVPEYEQIKEHKISLQYFIKNRFAKNFVIENNSCMPMSENRPLLPVSQEKSLEPQSENVPQVLQDRDLEPQCKNVTPMLISENRPHIFQDISLMPVSESSSLIPISEKVPQEEDQNITFLKESANCTSQGAGTSIDNHATIPLKVDFSNLFREPIVVNKKICKYTALPDNLTLSMELKCRYNFWRYVGRTDDEALILCQKPVKEIPEYGQITEHTGTFKQFLKIESATNNSNSKIEPFFCEKPWTYTLPPVKLGTSYPWKLKGSAKKQIQMGKPAKSAEELQSGNGYLRPTSENSSQVFQDRSLMPVSESSSLVVPISENGPVPQGVIATKSFDQNITFFNESANCINQGADISIDNHANIPSKVDFNNFVRGPIIVNKKIRMNTALPNNLTLSIELKYRYNFWRYVGRTHEEALVLCQKPLNEIPEYAQIKEQTGTFRQFLKNKSASKNSNSKNLPIFCETPLAWTCNTLPPLKLGTSYSWKLKGSTKKRYDYWIQMGKSAEEAKVLSQRPYRENQQKILKDNKNKSKRWKKLNRNMNEYKSIIMKKIAPLRHLNINTGPTQPANVNTTNKMIGDRKTPQENAKTNKDKPKLTEKQLTLLNWWMQQGKSEEEAYILCQKPMAISDAYAIVLEHQDTIDSIRQDKNDATVSINQEPCENDIEIENSSKQRSWENASQQIFKDTTRNICPSILTQQEVIRPQMPRQLLHENSTKTEKAKILRFCDNVAEIQNSSHPKVFEDTNENICPSILKHQEVTRPQITEHLPREISIETEKVSKLRLFKNIGTQNLSELNVCIKDANKAICHKDYVALRDAITYCIGDDEEIKISRCVRKSGCVIVICADERSRDWVDKQIPTLEPWEGAQLTIIDEDKIPTLFNARVFIPTVPQSGPLVGLEPEELMSKLHQQNPNVGCDKWNVLDTQVQKEGLLLIVRFDGNSKDVLQSQGLILNWYSSLRRLRVKLMKKKNQNQELVIDPPYQENVSEGGLSNMSQVDDWADRNQYSEMAAGMLTADASISRDSRGDFQSATPVASNEKRHVSPYLEDTQQQGLRDESDHAHETDSGREKDYYHHTGDKAGSVWSADSHWLERRHDTDQATRYFHQEDISVRSPDYVQRTDTRAGSEWGYTSQLLPEHRSAIGYRQDIPERAPDYTHRTGERAGSEWSLDTPQLLPGHRAAIGYRQDIPERAPDYTHHTGERTGSEGSLDTPQLLPEHRAAIGQVTQNTHRKDIPEEAPDYTYQTGERAGSEWGLDTPHLLPNHRAAIVQATHYTHQEDVLWAPDYTHQADDCRSPKRASRPSDRGRSEWGVNTPQLLPEHQSAFGHATEYNYQEDIAVRAPDHTHRENKATDSSRRKGVKRAISNSLREDKAFKKIRQEDYNHERTKRTEKHRTEYSVHSRHHTEFNGTEYRDARRSESSRSHTRRSGDTECYRIEYRDKRRPRRAISPRSHPRPSEGHGLTRRN